MALPQIGVVKYNCNIPSSGKTVEYRPYTVKEEKVLLMAMESRDYSAQVSAAKDLVKNCVYAMSKKDVDNLSMFDFEYLFLKLRSKSVGEVSDLHLGCECGVSTKVSINLDEISVKGKIKPSTKLMVTNDVGVMISYPKLKGVERQAKNNGDKVGDYESTVNLLASCIDSIFDKENVYDAADHTPKELVNFIESLSSGMFKQLLELFEELPSLEEDVDFKCTGCGKDNHVKLKGLQSFF